MARARRLVPRIQDRRDLPHGDAHGLMDSLDWSAFYLCRDGVPVEENAAQCPRTMAALANAPLPRIKGRAPSVLFSILKPGVHVAAHHGRLNTMLTCHLPLEVPAGASLRVGDDQREWSYRKAWAFDESTFLWNMGWFKYSLLNLRQTPLESDYISFPLGIRLTTNTFNLFNATFGLPLQLAFSLPLASNLILLFSYISRLDWVGLDVKAPSGQYPVVTGVQGSGLGGLVTLELVRQAGIAHEVRTTVHPALTPPEALVELAAELAAAGVSDWVLQPFRTAGCADAALIAETPQGATIDEALLARLRERVPGTMVR